MNCWIDQRGRIIDVPLGQHLVLQRARYKVRVSMPELRRTWVGIEIFTGVSSAAKTTTIKIVRSLRRQGHAIRVERGGRLVDCQPFDRPADLYRLIQGLK